MLTNRNLAFMPNLTTVLINEYFSHPCENAKLAASYAYGILIVGNLDYFLPPILDEISQNFRKQYLLLNSLREVVIFEKLLHFYKIIITEIFLNKIDDLLLDPV